MVERDRRKPVRGKAPSGGATSSGRGDQSRRGDQQGTEHGAGYGTQQGAGGGKQRRPPEKSAGRSAGKTQRSTNTRQQVDRTPVNPLLEDVEDDAYDEEYVAENRNTVETVQEDALPDVDDAVPGVGAGREHGELASYHEQMYEDYDSVENIADVSYSGDDAYDMPEMDDTSFDDVSFDATDEGLPDLSFEDLHEELPDVVDTAALYNIPDMSEEDYEEAVSFESEWDAGTGSIIEDLQKSLEQRELSLTDDGGALSSGSDALSSDDRAEVLEALLGGGMDADSDMSDSDDHDEGLLEAIHENSPFAAVDDEDGVPDWFSLDRVLADAIDDDVSDVYITPDNYIHFKKLGLIEQRKEYGYILADMTEKLYQSGMITNVQEDEFIVQRELDASYVMRSGQHTGRRFRLSLGNTLSAPYLNFRIIPDEVPSPAELNVPDEIVQWSKLSRGIFMINGPTGSGKSTTIASLIRQIQLQQRKTIITIEKPIEFAYPKDGKSLVIQRHVGVDTLTFSSGLKTSLRNSPDIIVVGEVRDREEVDELLRAAESGHLAISTMHTETCAGTISRMTGLYEGEDRKRVTDVLSTVGRGFANQLLLRSPDGSKRTAIHEILTVDDEVAALIAANDVHGIEQYQRDRKQSMDHQIARALLRKECSLDDAYALVSRPSALDTILDAEDFS